ncbi:MAG: hypothetical protein RLZZ293_885 [Pseudomonadota bacterium]|jgi:leucyl aminopeptidase
MQLKIKNHVIECNLSSINSSINSQANVFFSFSHEIETKLNQLNPNHQLFDDLTNAGSFTQVNNNFLVSLGSQEKYNLTTLSNVASQLAKLISQRKITNLAIYGDALLSDQLNLVADDNIEKFLVDFANGLYYFDTFKTTKTELSLTQLNLISQAGLDPALFTRVNKIIHGYFLVRDLANSPSNLATPSYLAKTAEDFVKLNLAKVKAIILDRQAIEQEQMHTFLGVAKGSSEEPKFIRLEYTGTNSEIKPIVLVGKGITFDSGGISLKPGANMDDMKYDMCGAATVLGVFAAVASLDLAVNLVVLVPTCENMPSGHAQKPGDIVKSRAGKTIEILNTDAEGRLILCDALDYAKQFNPEFVIDVATLTGACVIALGSVASGLYVNDEELHQKIQQASVLASDKVWRMPLFDEYANLLKGNHADLLNIGGWGGKGGSVTAAMFLKEFTDYKWAHLDIAGTAHTVDAKGSTGRPFKLLLELIRHHAKTLEV